MIDGRFVLEGFIGRGGVARVYLARALADDRRLAIKVVPANHAATVRRVRREARAQINLRHPHVVPVHDALVLRGAFALVADYIEGPDLAAMLQAHRLPHDAADLMARGVLRGVAAAHARGLVHRDLKPSNVLVEIGRHALVPRITDFGLVKSLVGATTGVPLTQSGSLLGTPSYMAPEQVHDARIADIRADVFSLGAILYQLMSGERAFVGQSFVEIFRLTCSGEYTPLDTLAPDTPPQLVELIHAALAVDPKDRPPHAGALLQAWEAGRPAPPWPPHIVTSARLLIRAPAPLPPADRPEPAPEESTARPAPRASTTATVAAATVGGSATLLASAPAAAVAAVPLHGGPYLLALGASVLVASGAGAAAVVFAFRTRDGRGVGPAWWTFGPSLVVTTGAGSAAALALAPLPAPTALLAVDQVLSLAAALGSGMALASALLHALAWRLRARARPGLLNALAVTVAAVAAVVTWGVCAATTTWPAIAVVGLLAAIGAAGLAVAIAAGPLPRRGAAGATAARTLTAATVLGALPLAAIAAALLTDARAVGRLIAAPPEVALAVDAAISAWPVGNAGPGVAASLTAGALAAVAIVGGLSPGQSRLLRQLGGLALTAALAGGALTAALTARHTLALQLPAAVDARVAHQLLGARLTDGGAQGRGALVVDGPAPLVPGDLVVRAGNRPVHDVRALLAIAASAESPLAVDVVRAGAVLPLRIATAPAAPAASP